MSNKNFLVRMFKYSLYSSSEEAAGSNYETNVLIIKSNHPERPHSYQNLNKFDLLQVRSQMEYWKAAGMQNKV
eukprot:snap_masked-scaffold_65-processed-gene-0.4-mRNA-1 protein AED:1.00 eAED:1.00 QI:0/0/0/0/1/1/2/0/72